MPPVAAILAEISIQIRIPHASASKVESNQWACLRECHGQSWSVFVRRLRCLHGVDRPILARISRWGRGSSCPGAVLGLLGRSTRSCRSAHGGVLPWPL